MAVTFRDQPRLAFAPDHNGRMITGKHVQAYTGRCKEWRGRYVFLAMHTTVLCRDTFSPTAADENALRLMAKDRELPVLERFHAQLIVSQFLWEQGRTEQAVGAYRKVITIAALASPEHRQERVAVDVPLHDISARGVFWQLVGERLDAAVKSAKENIASLGAVDFNDPPPPRPGKAERGNSIIWPLAPAGGNEQELERGLRNAMSVRRTACAHCGTADAKLSCCNKCKAIWYCSPACQRAGWGVHKGQCRSPGKYREGDIVRLQGLRTPTHSRLNGQIFAVIGPDPDKPGRWLVQHRALQNGKALSVKQDTVRLVLTH